MAIPPLTAIAIPSSGKPGGDPPGVVSFTTLSTTGLVVPNGGVVRTVDGTDAETITAKETTYTSGTTTVALPLTGKMDLARLAARTGTSFAYNKGNIVAFKKGNGTSIPDSWVEMLLPAYLDILSVKFGNFVTLNQLGLALQGAPIWNAAAVNMTIAVNNMFESMALKPNPGTGDYDMIYDSTQQDRRYETTSFRTESTLVPLIELPERLS